MNKFVGRAGMVLIGWMLGTGCLWADQTPEEALTQAAQTLNLPTVAGADAASSAGLDTPTSTKSSGKKSKKGKTSKTTKIKKAKKKSTKTSKKSKSGKKSKKKSSQS